MKDEKPFFGLATGGLTRKKAFLCKICKKGFEKMLSAKVCIMIAIAIYLIAMLGVGIYCSKKNNNVDDFYLGGRKLGPFVTAMSAEASDMSSWLLMGLPGVAYLTGVADAAWTAIGLAIGTYFNWLIIAKRIRIYSHVADNSITVPDFFSRRYRDNKNILMCISAIVIIVFFIPYTASGFAACGKLFSSLFGVDYVWAMIISAVVIVGYTATGGFLAASATDLIQSIFMTVALIIILLFGVKVAGGWDTIITDVQAMPGYLNMTETYSVATGTAEPYSLLTIVSVLAWGLGYCGMPHILLRFMAIEDKEKLTLSRRVASIWVVISMAIAVSIGIVGYAMTKAGAIPFLEGSTSETIIVRIADLLSQQGVIAAFVAGIILAGILAATMSTADSQLLAASSSVSQNLLRGFFKVNISEKTAMTIARITVCVISVIAIFLARDPNSSVFGIVSFAWAGFGASFGPVVVFALFWKRSNKYGALAGMIAGGVMVFVWKYLVAPLGGAFGIYELLPAFVFGALVNIIVSLATPAPEKEIVEEFELVQKLYKQKA